MLDQYSIPFDVDDVFPYRSLANSVVVFMISFYITLMQSE